MSVAELQRPLATDATEERPASAIYEGRVAHRRLDPIEHSFAYPLFMAYLDLDELPELFDPYWLWSARRPAPAWFRRGDHLGDPRRPLADCVRELVAERGGEALDGPVRVLTNLRYLGHCFNPVSFFYCHRSGQALPAAVLAEVHNTPWGERHAYVISGRSEQSGSEDGISGRLEKSFHVSPLMSMDHVYEWHSGFPGETLRVEIASASQGRPAFEATLSMRRRELSAPTLRRMLARYPAMTAQVVARIYWQALRLKLKGAPYFPHPGRGGSR